MVHLRLNEFVITCNLVALLLCVDCDFLSCSLSVLLQRDYLVLQFEAGNARFVFVSLGSISRL